VTIPLYAAIFHRRPAPLADPTIAKIFRHRDDRQLGASFRERGRIKRKKQRWTSRLHRLPMLERQALLAAIDDAWRMILSPEMTMPPATSPFSPMPGPASPELARVESSIAGNDEGGIAIFGEPLKPIFCGCRRQVIVAPAKSIAAPGRPRAPV
jgi:hypothetical protein